MGLSASCWVAQIRVQAVHWAVFSAPLLTPISNKCILIFGRNFFHIPISFYKKKMHLVPVNDLLSGWDCLPVAACWVAQIRVQTVPWAVFSAPLRLQPNISCWLYEPFTYCSTLHCYRGQHENHKHSQTPSGKQAISVSLLKTISDQIIY